MYNKSALRYPGGKSKALKKIIPHIPLNIKEYREPFIGGGSVFLTVKQLFTEQINQYWINDLNFDLYCFWLYAQTDIKLLVEEVKKIKEKYRDGRNLFNYFKSEDIKLSDFERAVRFFILNRITFSGTVDSGGYSQQAFEKRFTNTSIERLENLSVYLLEVQITHGDYTNLLFAKGDHTFIFLDPPYLSVTKSKLYGKKGDLHTIFDHEKFAQNMQKCKHKWLITYDDCSEVRELFSFANVYEWELQYGMNNYKQEIAKKGKELFITNYPIVSTK
jgi:DNA adenine methylase